MIFRLLYEDGAPKVKIDGAVQKSNRALTLANLGPVVYSCLAEEKRTVQM